MQAFTVICGLTKVTLTAGLEIWEIAPLRNCPRYALAGRKVVKCLYLNPFQPTDIAGKNILPPPLIHNVRLAKDNRDRIAFIETVACPETQALVRFFSFWRRDNLGVISIQNGTEIYKPGERELFITLDCGGIITITTKRAVHCISWDGNDLKTSTEKVKS
ncbi:MAG: hypothetical protein WC805_03385 [Patescibacteria group bacterium]|jgi:hypothetical protein